MKACCCHFHTFRAMRLASIAAAMILVLGWANAARAQEPTGGDADRIHISAGQAVGSLISKTPPIYPPLAKAARISGTVVLEVTISKAGEVKELHVISGPAMLQQAAMDAVKT